MLDFIHDEQLDTQSRKKFFHALGQNFEVTSIGIGISQRFENMLVQHFTCNASLQSDIDDSVRVVVAVSSRSLMKVKHVPL
ncbi:hypothetical protein AL00_17290 [Sphingobium indicum F2]|uniref:Uncharacterized protein n=1 Tax=Sphingobium indicum F2 TaxID=1450518 RepID=A0A8E1C1V2_9SPHN|nr:hypothetical protein AL00_17290 [Sphingobium indicum F2]